jgi:hypothetical protein
MMRVAQWASDQIERLQLGAPSWVGPTGEIALSLDLRWEPEGLFMLINSYIDESYNDKFLMMAGYVARLGQWNEFDRAWKKLLKKFDLSYFHSNEMVARVNEYKKWDDHTEIDFCSAAERLCRKYKLSGFTVRIDFADYKTDYCEYLPVKGFRLDTIYGLAFRYIVAYVPGLIIRSLKRNDLTINFIIEVGHKNFGDTMRVLEDIKKRVPDFGKSLGSVIPGTKKMPGCQAADALAAGAYRGERDGGLEFHDIPQDMTLADLRKRRLPRAPAVRNHATPELLRDIKDAAYARDRGKTRHAT